MSAVVVVDYDARWPELFESIRLKLSDSLGRMATAIEHVGSTAVPGLAAKPIIDIDVLLASAAMLPAAIERLAELGYTHQGDLGIPGREAFRTAVNDPARNLYVCPPESAEFRRHIAFRDYLRVHPEAAKSYGDLKKKLAIRFANDRDAYVDGKSEFVAAILDRAMGGSRSTIIEEVRNNADEESPAPRRSDQE